MSIIALSGKSYKSPKFRQITKHKKRMTKQCIVKFELLVHFVSVLLFSCRYFCFRYYLATNWDSKQA